MAKKRPLPYKLKKNQKSQKTDSESQNLFLQHKVRSKFDVLGRNNEQVKRNHHRDADEALRKRTLGAELEGLSRSNKFIDRRLGERDHLLSAQDKAMARFQRQRVKRQKNVFNLDDDEEEKVVVLGDETNEKDNDKKLAAFVDLPAREYRVDDDGNIVSDAEEDEVNPFRDAAERHKAKGKESRDGDDVLTTRRERLKMRIQDDRMARYAKERQQELDLDFLDEIDGEFDEIRQELAQNALPTSSFAKQNDNSTESEAQREKLKPALSKDGTGDHKEGEDQDEDEDDFTRILRELQSSNEKAIPTQRLRTHQEEEDIRRKRKEKAEKVKMQRMAGEVYEADSDDEDDYQMMPGQETKSQDPQKSVVDVPMVSESDDEIEDTENSEIQEEVEEQVQNEIESSSHSIPDVITVPTSYTELTHLLENRTHVERVAIHERIFGSNGFEFRKRKTQIAYFAILFEHFGHLTKNAPMPMKELNVITEQMYRCLEQHPQELCIYAKETLRNMKNSLDKKLLKVGSSAPGQITKAFPPLQHIMYAKLLGTLFAASDFFHNITTPTATYLNQCLAECPVMSAYDLVLGLFISSILLSLTRESKRISPEVLAFVSNVIASASVTNNKTCISTARFTELPPSIPQFDIRYPVCVAGAVEEAPELVMEGRGKRGGKDVVGVIDVNHVVTAVCTGKDKASETTPVLNESLLRLQSLSAAYNLVDECRQQWTENICFHELFRPVLTLLNNLKQHSVWEQYPSAMKSKHRKLSKHLEQDLPRSIQDRIPLELQTPKQEEVAMLEPAFHARFSDLRQAEKVKKGTRMLQRKVRQEERKAQRELRKDTEFVFRHKQVQKTRVERERKAKYKQILGMLKTQATEGKQLDLANRNERRKERRNRKESRGPRG